MSTLEPKPSRRLSRRSRERRAYRLLTVGGTASAVAAVGLVLALVGIVGAWLPLVAVAVAVVCVVLFRGTVRG